MHLDVAEVDLTSHIHVPTVSVQSRVPSDVLSNGTGHAAAVASQCLPSLGRMIAPAAWCLIVIVFR